MDNNTELRDATREEVFKSYESAKASNRKKFLQCKDDKATSEYIYSNQMEDANNIVNLFYQKDENGMYKKRVVSVQKKTKVGADGLMIEIIKLLTTHNDDDFVIDPDNVRIITGMSNVTWESDMIEKAPTVFKDKIFHHGKLKKADFENIKEGLFIIDEIDTGNGEFQRLHTVLDGANILDIDEMVKNNNRFILISATMMKELYELYRWGDYHELYKMTIPDSYIGHKDFLDKGIIKEFYPISNENIANKWIKEDILDFYGDEFRVHIIRIKASRNKNNQLNDIQKACIRNKVECLNHNSIENNSKTLEKYFTEPLDKHVVVIVKDFFRRANLIPNKWKLRIGAIHEYFTKKVDNNTQIQGLIGRMTGYWRFHIENGHKTGPFRTSVKAVEQYEESYNNPFGNTSYETSGFSKKKGKYKSTDSMLAPKNIHNLVPIDGPIIKNDFRQFTRTFDSLTKANEFAKEKQIGYSQLKENDRGFYECSLTECKVFEYNEACDKIHKLNPGSIFTKRIKDSIKKGIKPYAGRHYVGYTNLNDPNSAKFILYWIELNN